MIKKSLFLLLAALLLSPVFFAAAAQHAQGTWTIYSRMGATIDDIIETPSKVYYLSGGALHSYSPDDNEHYSYSTSNKLSDVDISKIFYNTENGYLLIVYSNGNLDMLYDDGRCYNMPDIKDATLTGSKAVNDVAFSGDRFYLVTDFGLVVYNADRHEVVESGIYNIKLTTAFVMQGYIFVAKDRELYVSPVDERHNTWDKFRLFVRHAIKSAQPVSDTKYVYVNVDKYIGVGTINFDKMEHSSSTTSTKIDTPIRRISDGFYGYVKDRVYFYGPEGTIVSSTALPEGLQGHAVGVWANNGRMWLGDREGIGRYDFSSGTPTVLADKYRPNVFTVSVPAFMRWSADGERLYVSNIGPSQYYSCSPDDGLDVPHDVNIVDGSDIIDASPYNVEAVESETKSRQNRYGNLRAYGGPTKVTEDPDDPTLYYAGNGLDGLYAIRNGEQVAHFTKYNSQIMADWGTRVFDVNTDPQGNLWVMSWTEYTNVAQPLVILPAAKRRDIANVTANDWVVVKMPDGYKGNKDAQSLFCTGSNFVIYATSQWESGIVAIDTHGKYSDVSAFTMRQHTYFIDTEGNTLRPHRVHTLAEDRNGRIWVGTNEGLFVISNPSDLTSEVITVKRPLVPRNDGTNFGDYLLETEKIYQIVTDHTNRKWIATENSGVYLVSEDGTEILENFTESNSPLLSNTVYSIACDPHSNLVYFGTSKGVVGYNSTSSPPSEDYSDVYAYPNPVRPEYTGWITVTGLMENSLVKIADSAGNVFVQGRSEGGSFVWDGCNSAGDRVRSGVYFVFASQNENGSSAVVTKIVVIN